MNATKFDRDDLMILNIFAPPNYDENQYGGDTWANTVASGAPEYFATDYDGTTTGDSTGINVLIRREDQDSWENSASAIGCETDACWDVVDGHYGDSNYAGIDIVSVPNSDNKVYWIE